MTTNSYQATGKTQADGAFELDVPNSDSARRVSVQFTFYNSGGTVAAPGAGTVEIQARLAGATEYEDMTDNVIAVTTRGNWLQTFEVAGCRKLKFTPDSVTGTATYDVYVSAV